MADHDGTAPYAKIADAALQGDRPLSTALEHKLRANEYHVLRRPGAVGHHWRAHDPEESGKKLERMLVSGTWAIWHMVPSWRVTPGLRRVTVRASLLVTNRRGAIAPADIQVAFELEGFGRTEATLTGDLDTDGFETVLLTLDFGRALREDVRVPLLLWLKSGLDNVAGGYILSVNGDRSLSETPDNWPLGAVDFGPYIDPTGDGDAVVLDMVADGEMLVRPTGIDGMEGGYGYLATLRRRALIVEAEYEPVGGAWAVYDQARIRARRGVRAGDVRPHIINARAAWSRPRVLAAGARATLHDGDETQWRIVSPYDGDDLLNECVWLDRSSGTLEVTVAVAAVWSTASRAVSKEDLAAARAQYQGLFEVSLTGLAPTDTGWSSASLTPAGVTTDETRELVLYPTDLSTHAPPLLRALAAGRIVRPPATWTMGWRDGVLYPGDLSLVQYITVRIPYSGATDDQPYRMRIVATDDYSISAPGLDIPLERAHFVVVGSCVWDEGSVDALADAPRLSDVRRGAPIDALPFERAARLVDRSHQRAGQMGPCVHFDDLNNGFINTFDVFSQVRATGGPGLEAHEWMWRSSRVDVNGNARLHVYSHMRNAELRITITPASGGSATVATITRTTVGEESLLASLTPNTTYLITFEVRRATAADQAEIYALGIRDYILPQGATP